MTTTSCAKEQMSFYGDGLLQVFLRQINVF